MRGQAVKPQPVHSKSPKSFGPPQSIDYRPALNAMGAGQCGGPKAATMPCAQTFNLSAIR